MFDNMFLHFGSANLYFGNRYLYFGNLKSSERHNKIVFL